MSYVISPGPYVAADEDRRNSPRIRTVYRIVRVKRGEDEGLGRVRNISDGGMKLELGFPADLNDVIDVELSPGVVVKGQVVWINGNERGLRFDVPIDSIQALANSAQEVRAPGARAPRLKAFIPAVTHSEQGVRAARVADISQAGMKLEHDGGFTPGLQMKVTLCSGVERRGVVRWVEGKLAGLLLAEPFTVEELGSMRRLADGE